MSQTKPYKQIINHFQLIKKSVDDISGLDCVKDSKIEETEIEVQNEKVKIRTGKVFLNDSSDADSAMGVIELFVPSSVSVGKAPKDEKADFLLFPEN